MADRAVGRKCCCRVAGVSRPLIIGLMAIDTRCAGQVVIVIDVARSAGHAHVRTGQRKAGQGVIEGRVGPGCCCMARLAIGGKAAQDVIGVCGALELLHVTVGTSGICGSQVVVVVHVTGSAGHGHMCSGQRKSRSVVVEVRLRPGIYSVTGLASC